MIPIPSRVRVWIATGHTDMRRGMNSLALLVQEAFKRDPHGGDLYVFRGKSGKLINFSGTMASACRSTPSGWNAAGSSGHRRLTAQW
jgi:transposase